jgi:hypothetical protein
MEMSSHLVIFWLENIRKRMSFSFSNTYKMKALKLVNKDKWTCRMMMNVWREEKDIKRWRYFVCPIKRHFKWSFYMRRIRRMKPCSQVSENKVVKNLKNKYKWSIREKIEQISLILQSHQQESPAEDSGTRKKYVRRKKATHLFRISPENNEDRLKFASITLNLPICYKPIKWGSFWINLV